MTVPDTSKPLKKTPSSFKLFSQRLLKLGNSSADGTVTHGKVIETTPKKSALIKRSTQPNLQRDQLGRSRPSSPSGSKPKPLKVSSTSHKLVSSSGNESQRSRSNTSSTHIRSPPSSSQKMVYNPYGMNNTSTPNTISGNSKASTKHKLDGSHNGNQPDDLSFYMHDGDAKVRMLPLPISDPNEWLPEDMKQISVHMSDNFVFDKENKTIGSGGSSEVRKVRSAYKSKNIYALKKLNMIYDETPEQFYKRCSKEFIIAKHLSGNIHITHTFQLVKVPTTIYTSRGWGFVMELGNRDLFQLIERSGWKNVPINEKYCLFKQVAEGIKFCHDQGVAHRDLKPENILLNSEGVCKLTDFGISDWYHKDPQDFNSEIKQCAGMIGSPPYAPPEVMMYDSKKKFPEKLQKPYNPLLLDSYALGILLFTLVMNTVPFFESCSTDARFRDYENAYNNFIKHQNKQFRDKGVYKAGPGVEFMLARKFQNTECSRVAWRLADPDASTRYSIADLFADPWFQKIETCVDCGDHSYAVQEPEIRKNTTNVNASHSSLIDIGSRSSSQPRPDSEPVAEASPEVFPETTDAKKTARANANAPVPAPNVAKFLDSMASRAADTVFYTTSLGVNATRDVTSQTLGLTYQAGKTLMKKPMSLVERPDLGVVPEEARSATEPTPGEPARPAHESLARKRKRVVHNHMQVSNSVTNVSSSATSLRYPYSNM